MNPYRHIALAATFSPRFPAMLKEAVRFAGVTGAELSLIHAGDRTPEAEKKFEEHFRQLALSPTPNVFWEPGDPTSAIVNEVERNGIDLLIAGAMGQEASGRHFLGDVARGLMHQMPCSLLLLPNPSAEPVPLKQIAVLVDYSEISSAALRVAIALCEAESAEVLHVVRIYTVFAQALAQAEKGIGGGMDKDESQHKEIVAAEDERLEAFVIEAGETAVPIRTLCVEGTTGFAASDYVQGIGAHLLVIPSERPGSIPLFPPGADWIVDVIPTNLLVVRG